MVAKYKHVLNCCYGEYILKGLWGEITLQPSALSSLRNIFSAIANIAFVLWQKSYYVLKDKKNTSSQAFWLIHILIILWTCTTCTTFYTHWKYGFTVGMKFQNVWRQSVIGRCFLYITKRNIGIIHDENSEWKICSYQICHCTQNLTMFRPVTNINTMMVKCIDLDIRIGSVQSRNFDVVSECFEWGRFKLCLWILTISLSIISLIDHVLWNSIEFERPFLLERCNLTNCIKLI